MTEQPAGNQPPANPDPPAAKKTSLDVVEGLFACVAAPVALYMLLTAKLEGWALFTMWVLLIAGSAGIVRFIERIVARLRSG